MRVYEAARLRVQESVYDVAQTKQEGFVPLRYRPLDPRWQPMDAAALGPPAWQRDAATAPSEFRGAATKNGRFDTRPLEDAAAGAWVRYAVIDDGLASLRTLLATAAGKTIDVQCAEVIDTRMLPTGRVTPRTQDLPNVLVDLLAFYEPLVITRVTQHRVEAGTYRLGERRFPARRHSLEVAGETTVRHQTHPMWLEITAVLSDDVPLNRVVTADYTLAIDWRLTGRREDARPVRTTLVVDAFGKRP
jgi:hypothetical protein